MTQRVDIRGADEAIVRLETYGRRISDWLDFWDDAEDAVQRRERIWLSRQGEGTWPPLSKAYAARKARERPGKPMLVYDGDLRDVLTSDKFTVARTPRELWMQTRQSGAGFHHTGTGKMPKRDPIAPLDRLAAGIGQRGRQWVQYARLGMFA